MVEDRLESSKCEQVRSHCRELDRSWVSWKREEELERQRYLTLFYRKCSLEWLKNWAFGSWGMKDSRDGQVTTQGDRGRETKLVRDTKNDKHRT